MAEITLKEHVIHTTGDLPAEGTKAPDFKLTTRDLHEVTLENYKGKKKVFNIFPSIDTPTCATSVRAFNKSAASLPNTVVLNISADLPFAQKRFCAAEDIANVEVLSCFRATFAEDYKLKIKDSILAGLCSRVVLVLDENDTIIYREQVKEISNEPNYEAALAAVKFKGLDAKR